MCIGGGGDVAAPAEEWSPIRESALPQPLTPHHQTADRFPAEEPGFSSDVETEENAVARVREASGGATVGGNAGGVAAHNIVDFDATGGSEGTLDSSGGSSFVTARASLSQKSKRKRVSELGQNPVVEVTYEGLTRESKYFLQQALQSWSFWHSRSYAWGMEATEGLESGTEVYSPTLALEPTSGAGSISVWIDKPLKRQKSKIQNIGDGCAVDKESQDNEFQAKEKDVPLYDRACNSALPSQDLVNPDGFVYIEREEVPRCFNCGSYSHALRSCPRPHSATAIKIARDVAFSKSGPRPRTPSRYYQSSQASKFDDLRPGVLSPEARMAIGIGELDPPPWLHRMREIGYPPGYLEEEEESSGLQIIDDDIQAVTGKESINVVESCVPGEEYKAGQKMTVDYPGINAIILDKTNNNLWATPPEVLPVRSEVYRKPFQQINDNNSWAPTPEMEAVGPEGCRRPFHQVSQMHNNGSRLFSPQSPWMVEYTGNPDLWDEGYVRSTSRSPIESSSRSRFDQLEPQIDVSGSVSCHATTSSVLNTKGILSVDSAIHWSNRRVTSPAVDGTNFHDTRFGTQSCHHIRSSTAVLVSSTRSSILGTPGTPEPKLSMAPIYSHHNQYQNQTQTPGVSLPNCQGRRISDQILLEAQLRPDTAQTNRISGSVLAPPNHVSIGTLNNFGDPRVHYQMGRR